jgi:hypothetical protein
MELKYERFSSMSYLSAALPRLAEATLAPLVFIRISCILFAYFLSDSRSSLSPRASEDEMSLLLVKISGFQFSCTHDTRSSF